MNVSFREQVLTMMNFRKGIINCLFATSVAEEGLDIPDCNLVIRFDLYTTLIQYIQSRGRARHENSRYIHMCEDGNQEHHQIIREVRQNENILKRFCSALPEDRLLTGNSFNMDHFLNKERTHRVWTHPETRAKLTYKMSLAVLANFVDSLPRGPDTNLQPEYVVTVQNKQFVGEVILPEASPLRGAVGRPASTKQVAKCSAAFETCLQLVKGKYLDEWLLPTFTKQLPAMRNALLAVDSKKRESYDMKTKPDMWSVGGVSEQLYLTVMALEAPEVLDRPCQPLALLTKSPLPQLPSFFLHFGADRHSQILTTPIALPLDVSSDLVQLINTFTLCIFDDVFSKGYESDPAKMPYFLVPIVSDAKVDVHASPAEVIAWDILQSIQDHQSKWASNLWGDKSWQTESDDFFNDKYIVDPYDGSRKLWAVGVTRMYKPLDPVPPNTAPRKGTRKNNDNIMEYSCSLWAKARSRRTFDTEQRVIEAEFIPLRRNLLDDFDRPEEDTPKKCFIILEPLKISPVSIRGSEFHLPLIMIQATNNGRRHGVPLPGHHSPN
jgi:endoribonuclease Dicer